MYTSWSAHLHIIEKVIYTPVVSNSSVNYIIYLHVKTLFEVQSIHIYIIIMFSTILYSLTT